MISRKRDKIFLSGQSRWPRLSHPRHNLPSKTAGSVKGETPLTSINLFFFNMVFFSQIKIKENNIKEAIVKTIAFFDLFDYPLTRQEIWKYVQILQNTPMIIYDILDSKKLNNIIEEKNGFYFLAGREKIIRTRMERYNYAGRKFKRAMLMAKIFKFIPWIKMIAIGNIIGAHNLKDNGDIDFFIITEPGRIWITRFFCVVAADLLGWRPKGNITRDKICLSFFASEGAMDLRELMLDGEPPKSSRLGAADSGGAGNADDIYFIYWLAGLALIYNKDGVYKKFIKANHWLKEYLPNWQPPQSANQRNSGKNFSCFYHNLIDLLFRGLEKNAKKLQLKKMPSGLKKIMNKDTQVVVNDQVLKLHVKDRREEYFRKWEEKLIYIDIHRYT